MLTEIADAHHIGFMTRKTHICSLNDTRLDMKLNDILRLAVVPALLLVAVACSPFKQTNGSQRTGAGDRTEYVLQLEKDAQAYLEIVEVKLMNSETKASESSTFRVLTGINGETLLNMKGYDHFVIVASTDNSELAPDQAIVVYKDEPEGDQKTKKIKPLVTPIEVE